MRQKSVARLVVLLALLVPIVAGPAAAAAAAAGQEATPVAGPAVVPPGGLVAGKTYGDWAGAWIRWDLDHPGTSVNCAAGQAGPVWFLPAIPVAAGAATIACAIPADRALLFPASISAGATVEACERSIDRPLPLADGVITAGGIAGTTIAVDGQTIPGLDRYRITLTPVPIGAAQGTSPVGPGWVICGYFVLLQPLPAGEHTVRLTLDVDGTLVEDLIYRLTVTPPGQA